MNVEGVVMLIGCFVGIAGFIVAFATLWGKHNADVKADTKESIEVHANLQSQIDKLCTVLLTRLDAIDNGMRDLKAERRCDAANFNKRFDELRDEIHDVNAVAHHALELAEASMRRLDRIGAEKDPVIEIKGE